MAKKLVCNISGNWQYCADDRYAKLIAKFGSEEALKEKYISREGQKALATSENDIEKAKAFFQGITLKNKIMCNVTGALYYISDDRMAHLCKKHNTNEAGIRKMYIGRVAKRVREELAQSRHQKFFDELDATQKSDIDNIIQDRHEAGTLPAPAVPKGTKKDQPKVIKSRVKRTNKPSTEIVDKVPANVSNVSSTVKV